MNPHFKLKNAVLLMALAAIHPLQGRAAVAAGTAQFAAGDVNLRNADGQTGPLQKGGAIESGQAIVTGATGRAQVRFSDGGLVSLQPNTEFKIANYVDRNDPKEDRFLVDLLRGSMRAITGLIGKRNRENFKLTTSTATIGIRGSGFNVGYNPDGTLGVTTELDAIEVCTSGGCVGLTAGESVRVVNSTDLPVRTNVRATVPTPAPDREPVVAGDQTNASGKADIVPPAPVVPPVPPVVRTFTDIRVVAVGTNGGAAYSLSTGLSASSVFSDNKLLRVDDTPSGFEKWSETGTPQPEVNFKSLGKVSDANFIGWGTWTSGQKDYMGTTLLDHVHYVTGRPTTQAQINTLFSATPYTATYTLIGNTAPTLNGVAGTLNSATFSVNFQSTQYTVNATLATSFGTIADAVTGTTASFSRGGGFIQGMFVGTNAGLAGLTYNKDLGSGMITGAAVFQK